MTTFINNGTLSSRSFFCYWNFRCEFPVTVERNPKMFWLNIKMKNTASIVSQKYFVKMAQKIIHYTLYAIHTCMRKIYTISEIWFLMLTRLEQYKCCFLDIHIFAPQQYLLAIKKLRKNFYFTVHCISIWRKLY